MTDLERQLDALGVRKPTPPKSERTAPNGPDAPFRRYEGGF